MLEQITNEIFLLKVPYPYGMSVNSYIIRGKRGLTIIDPGFDRVETRNLWKKAMMEFGEKIERVIITHTHPDHIGLAPWFQDTFFAPIYVSQHSKSEIDRGYRRSLEKLKRLWEEYVPISWPNPKWAEGFPENFQPDGLFSEKRLLYIGDREYMAIWTPGHASDQFCFYNPDEEIMFVSDHVIQETSPIVSYWNGEEEDPLADYMDSLEKISQFRVNLALPGHGSIIMRFSERVEEIKKRHDLRLEQILKLIDAEGKTVLDIVDEIYDIKNMRSLFSPILATLTRLLHLEKLGLIRGETIGKNKKFFPYNKPIS